MSPSLPKSAFPYITAPLVDQSDYPFRILTRKYGATLTFTQMLHPNQLIYDQDYREFHMAGILDHPIVAQVAGNNVQMIVDGCKYIRDKVDGIDINLGCPQASAKSRKYGAYLLPRENWSFLNELVSTLDQTMNLPISCKLRLCNDREDTFELARDLCQSGASMLTLHARYTSISRCRKGAADLAAVAQMVHELPQHVNVVTNGNVRGYSDLQANLDFTGADGIMVGETILGNPCLFSNIMPDPLQISTEYLELCLAFPTTTKLSWVKEHIERFLLFQWKGRHQTLRFLKALRACENVEGIAELVRFARREFPNIGDVARVSHIEREELCGGGDGEMGVDIGR